MFEVHDCFSIAEVLMYEALGLADHGKGTHFAADGHTRTIPQLAICVVCQWLTPAECPHRHRRQVPCQHWRRSHRLRPPCGRHRRQAGACTTSRLALLCPSLG